LRITASDITEALDQALALKIGKKRHELWFLGNTRLTCRDGELVIGVPNLFYHDWLQKTYSADLAKVAEEVLGEPTQVRFTIDPQLFKAGRLRQSHGPMPLFEHQAPATANPVSPESISAFAATATQISAAERASAPSRERVSPERRVSRPRRFRRLEDFVVGSCNRVAHAAALGLVEEPANLPAPLVFHGSVGTG
jgi:chromosomal replication initiator protein